MLVIAVDNPDFPHDFTGNGMLNLLESDIFCFKAVALSPLHVVSHSRWLTAIPSRDVTAWPHAASHACQSVSVCQRVRSPCVAEKVAWPHVLFELSYV